MTEKQINSHSIRIVGSFEIPVGVEMQDYEIKMTGSIISEKLKDNQDGTFDKEFTFKPLTGEVVDAIGKTMVMKDKRKESLKLRTLIEGFRQEFHADQDEEEFYAKFQAYLRSKFDDLAAGFKV